MSIDSFFNLSYPPDAAVARGKLSPAYTANDSIDANAMKPFLLKEILIIL